MGKVLASPKIAFNLLYVFFSEISVSISVKKLFKLGTSRPICDHVSPI